MSEIEELRARLAAAELRCRVVSEDERVKDGAKAAADFVLAALVEPVGEPPRPDPEQIARRFHEAYERLAPTFGYETREASAVPWEDVPDANRALMIATVAEVFCAVGDPQPPTRSWRDAMGAVPRDHGPRAEEIIRAGRDGAHPTCRACWDRKIVCPNPQGDLKPCDPSLPPHEGQRPCPSCTPPDPESETR